MASENPQTPNVNIDELLSQFINSSLRKRRGLLPALKARAEEISGLGIAVMDRFDREGDDWSAGTILKLLNTKDDSGAIKDWFSAPSSSNIDYEPLQTYLLNQAYEDADRFTSSKLRELAGEGAVSRGYVYFSEVESIPRTDLTTIDRLWVAYSEGKFGFSIQARLLASLNDRYDRLWPRIGWKNDGVWTRYPSAFTWDISAPEGHMPLVNQLRGIRLIDAILKHPAIAERCNIK